MSGTYREVNIGMKSLVGKKVLNALTNDSKDAVLLETDDGNYFLRWSGDCCAQCFIAHVNGADLLIGHTILEIENTEWSDVRRNDDECDVLETMGTKIKTDKGYVDIETRVAHNGYYSGMVAVSKIGFIDQYSCFEEVKDVNIKLEDF